MTQGETRRAIPPNLEGPILEKSAAGLSARAIAAWLEAEHAHRIGYATVARFIARTRSERADVAKVVVREGLAKTVLSDIEVLEKERERLRELAEQFFVKSMGEERFVSENNARYVETETYLKVHDRLAKLIDLKLKYAGADQPDDASTDVTQAAGERVARRLARLLSPEDADPRKPVAGGEGGA